MHDIVLLAIHTVWQCIFGTCMWSFYQYRWSEAVSKPTEIILSQRLYSVLKPICLL